MIVKALVTVKYPDSEEYQHMHVQMSEGPLHVPIELQQWVDETQKEQNCTLKIVDWKLNERADIGY